MKPQKTSTFVIMPFNDDHKDVYISGIKQACQDCDVLCERLDEQIFQENMLDKVCQEIKQADFIIADMTGKNPNVFFEAGYAFAQGKTIIFLCEAGQEIPFDLKQRQHIFYKTPSDLRDSLGKHIRYYLKKNDAMSITSNLHDITCTINGTAIPENESVMFDLSKHNDMAYPYLCTAYVRIQNNGNYDIDLNNLHFELSLPSLFSPSPYGRYDISEHDFVGTESQFIITAKDHLSPSQWTKKTLGLALARKPTTTNRLGGMLKIVGALGDIKLPFIIDCKVVLQDRAGSR